MPSAPVAEQRLHETMLHGTTLSDPWHGLRDTSYPVVDDPDVLAYVKAENAWFEAAMKPHEGLVETLFQEMNGRIKEEDASVPQKDGDFVYWVEYEQGAEYKTRSEEHTSELQSLMRTSYAVFCLNKKQHSTIIN